MQQYFSDVKVRCEPIEHWEDTISHPDLQIVVELGENLLFVLGKQVL